MFGPFYGTSLGVGRCYDLSKTFYDLGPDLLRGFSERKESPVICCKAISGS